MLTVVRSNRLEVLADRLVEELAASPAPPLAPEIVVVQSAGLARWLSFRMARALGIAVNVQFPLPAAFLWRTFRVLVPGVPATPALEPATAVWHVRALLAALDPGPPFEPLQRYLAQADERGRHELAARIADLFDQYLVHRPDWIARWEAGEGDGWQPALWRRLVARVPEPHRARVQAAAMQAMATSPGALPRRVALFGIPTMPPAHVQAFGRLAERIDVRLYHLAPSREYWELPRGRRAGDTPEPAHALLASLGKQGRDFIDVLLNHAAPGHEEDHWVVPGDDSLLHALQTDVFALRAAERPRPILPGDRSLQVHVCHTAMREIEVLHDQLHWLFERHPDLGPADVVVMTPDLEAYAPCVEAVFGGAEGARAIPFTIADRSLRAENPLVDGFLALLDLPGSRYDADRVLAVLDVPAMRRRFGLEAGDMPLVQRLVTESAVRWGTDAAMRARLDLPGDPEQTWRFGLDRLLLGFAVPSGDRRPRHGVPPSDVVEGSDAQVLGRLAAFVDAASALDGGLAGPRPVAAWVAALESVLARFVLPDDADVPAMDAIRSAAHGLGAAAGRASYDAPVSLELVRALLRRALEEAPPRGRFLAGGVTICAMVPMRSIPFEVVCLVGMNDGAFPRVRQPLPFDLMAAEGAREGDRSRRDDDRYLFLEAIASARRALYVSYVGRGVQDNAERPPAVVVSELLDAVRRGFDPPHLETVHPLQAFSARYFTSPPAPGLVSYSPALCEASRRRGGRRPVTRLLEGRLPEAPPEAYVIDLERWIESVLNPTAHLLRERLGVRLAEAARPVAHREPFVLGGLDAYLARTELLARRAELPGRDELLRDLRARGVLPLGRVGEVTLGRELAVVEDFADRLATATAGEPLETVPVTLALGRLRISGVLHDLARDGLVAFRLAKPTPRDLLRLWLRHLVLHAVRPRAPGWRSVWLGSTADTRVFEPVRDATGPLHDLAELYHEGLHRLLPLFPRTSEAWMSAPSRKREAARAAWEGNDFQGGEGAEPYLAYAWREVDPIDDDFEGLAARVWGPLQAHAGGRDEP